MTTPSITTLVHYRSGNRCVPALFVNANPKEDPTLLPLYGGGFVDASVPGCWHLEADCKNDSVANPAWTTADAAPVPSSFASAARKASPAAMAVASISPLPSTTLAYPPPPSRRWIAVAIIAAVLAIAGVVAMVLR